jgi:putative ABC transport system substrate-binding protein
MRRREFIGLLGGAAAWPLAARAQQSAMPVVGILNNSSHDRQRDFVAAFRSGLARTGYFEGRNLAIEYRWGEDQNDRLPALAADLIHRQVDVIVAVNTPTVLAVKVATKTVPIVFLIGTDPVELGLVASLARPGGNVTGFTTLNTELFAKRLEVLHELVPTAESIAFLVNPSNPQVAESEIRLLQIAARVLGVGLLIVNASGENEFDAAFATIAGERAGALLISADTLFRRDRIVALAARHAIPTLYPYRATAVAGGLMSYAANTSDQWREVGVYTSRILKGEKPADLPAQQATKSELVINMKTAKALGLTFPITLLAIADEVIE